MPLSRFKKVPKNVLATIKPDEINVAKDGNTVKLFTRLDGKIYELSLVATESAPASGGSGGTTDHGVLSGLGDDDHVQYLLIDGTRAMTGALTLSGLPTADLHAAGKGYVDQSIKRGAILFG